MSNISLVPHSFIDGSPFHILGAATALMPDNSDTKRILQKEMTIKIQICFQWDPSL